MKVTGKLFVIEKKRNEFKLALIFVINKNHSMNPNYKSNIWNSLITIFIYVGFCNYQTLIIVAIYNNTKQNNTYISKYVILI